LLSYNAVGHSIFLSSFYEGEYLLFITFQRLVATLFNRSN
jgi:hypothetical protein